MYFTLYGYLSHIMPFIFLLLFYYFPIFHVWRLKVQSKHVKWIYISTTAIKVKQPIGCILNLNDSKSVTGASCTLWPLAQSICLEYFLLCPVLLVPAPEICYTVNVQNSVLRHGMRKQCPCAVDKIKTTDDSFFLLLGLLKSHFSYLIHTFPWVALFKGF